MSDAAPVNVVVLGTDHPHVFALAEIVKRLPTTRLAGVYDRDEAQRAQAADRLAVPGFARVDEALATRPGLVVIGAVPSDRVTLAAQALAAGAAALVDKPLALTVEALDELRHAQQRDPRPVMVYYPYRLHPLVRAAKAALDAGRIGQLVRVFSAGPHQLLPEMRPAWYWTRAGNGGALIDIGSHHADNCLFFAGEAPDWICATHGNLTQPQHPEFQDFAQAQMRFPCGAFGHIEVDWLNPTSMKTFGDTRLWLQGTTGKIELRLGDEVSACLWNDQVAAEPIAPADDRDMDAELIEALALGRPPIIPQGDVWLTSRITLAAFASAERGGEPVRLADF